MNGNGTFVVRYSSGRWYFVSAAASMFNISVSTLSNKVNGKVSLKRKMGPATVLTTAEEQLLVSWLITCAKKGIPVIRRTLVETMHDIVEQDKRPTPFVDRKPGRKWFTSFLDRHKEIAERQTEGISKTRANVTEQNIRTWFNQLRNHLKENNCADILEDGTRFFNPVESFQWH